MSLGEIESGKRTRQQELPFGEDRYEKLLDAMHTMPNDQLLSHLEQEGITSRARERDRWMQNTYYVEEGRTFYTMSRAEYWMKVRKPELVSDFERILEHEAESFVDLQRIKQEQSRQFIDSMRAVLRPK